MALKAVHVSDVPNLDQVPDNASLSLYSTRFPKGVDMGRGNAYRIPKFLVIGHRGHGMNVLQSSDKRMRAIKENSIASFNAASSFPLDFIEFDVQVTKDGCPVIFHDDVILSENNGTVFERRVTELSLAEFLCYGPQSEPGKEGNTLLRKTKDGKILKWDVDTDDPLCTLQEAFQQVAPSLGFNIELKFDDHIVYQSDYLIHVIQAILQVVFEHAKDRAILFSTFQPDAALIVRKLQSTFPVFFLTNGGTEIYYDVRRNSLEEAIKLCLEGGLQGIVSEVKGVFRNPGAVTKSKEANLSFLTYGKLNNVPEAVYVQHLMGIDGVIVDLVREITEAVSEMIKPSKAGEEDGKIHFDISYFLNFFVISIGIGYERFGEKRGLAHMRSSATIRLFLICLILWSSLNFINGDESKKNKFREREASDDAVAYPDVNEDALLNTRCPRNLELRWQTEVSSSIYATPLIADINSDGKLDVVVPSFVHYLEVLEGSDGDKMPGWPAFHQSTVHASPLLYDIDKDGVREIALATYNGEVLFFRVSGYLMADKIEIPRRRVPKNWYVGLDSDHHVDRLHPDVQDDLLVLEAKMSKTNGSTSELNMSVTTSAESKLGMVNTSNTETERKINGSQPSIPELNISVTTSVGNEQKKNESQMQSNIDLPTSMDNSSVNSGSGGTVNAQNGTNAARRLLEDNNSKGSQDDGSKLKENSSVGHHVPTVEMNKSLEADADSSFELFRESEELADEYSYDYDDYVDESMWGDEEWTEQQHETVEDYVNIDSHILCTPVIADIDKDGVSEMVVAVSYFFDHEYYADSKHSKDLGDINIGKYVAGSIVVINLDTKQVKWTADLDLSTDTGNFRAYIYSSPTVVDLDGDGYMDILVGTSFGLFYVLDHHGKVREKFPLEMAEIQGAVVAADINDDGKIELVTADVHGNVAAWSTKGEEIWEMHLKSLVPQRPTVGDVDGDGHTDVVVPTVSGNIYVLSGKDGSIIRPYPYRTHGRVMNQVLLVDLNKRGEKNKGLTLVTTSFDGYLYLIDGPTSCADVVDIGETSYSMVLAENVDGGDDLDLIVTTMNGNVFCFSTPAQYHPLKAWRSHNQGRNNAATRYNREGIYVTHPSRAFRDEEGKSFWVEIEIVDRYRVPSGSLAPYNVTTTLLVPGNYQGERRIKQTEIFHRPGKYRIKLPTVAVRTTGTVLVEMVDKNGLYFSDDFSLTFHMYYYKLLKWLLVLPMLGMFSVLVILRPQEAMPLPSFSRNTDL